MGRTGGATLLNQEARPGLVPAIDGRQIEHTDILCLFHIAVQEDVAMHLAAGDPVYSCGLGDGTGKLFMHTPDGHRIEVRCRLDGSYERIRAVRHAALVCGMARGAAARA